MIISSHTVVAVAQFAVSAPLLFIVGRKVYQVGSYDIEVISSWFTLAGGLGIIFLLLGLTSLAKARFDAKLRRRYPFNRPSHKGRIMIE